MLTVLLPRRKGEPENRQLWTALMMWTSDPAGPQQATGLSSPGTTLRAAQVWD